MKEFTAEEVKLVTAAARLQDMAEIESIKMTGKITQRMSVLLLEVAMTCAALEITEPALLRELITMLNQRVAYFEERATVMEAPNKRFTD